MPAPLPDELEQRIAAVECIAAGNPGMRAADWLALAVTAVGIPVFVLALGWSH